MEPLKIAGMLNFCYSHYMYLPEVYYLSFKVLFSVVSFDIQNQNIFKISRYWISLKITFCLSVLAYEDVSSTQIV